jgi:hypothetical protein
MINDNTILNSKNPFLKTFNKREEFEEKIVSDITRSYNSLCTVNLPVFSAECLNGFIRK